MRPLESHLELSSHVWMLNRLRELLMREGLLAEHADDTEMRDAIDKWVAMVEEARAKPVAQNKPGAH